MTRTPALLSALAVLSLLAGCVAPPPGSPAAQILKETTEQSQPISQSQSISQSPISETTILEDESSSITTEQQLVLAGLPSRGVAPELFNETWLNSPPLKLADLRGKVVMIKFWTFG